MKFLNALAIVALLLLPVKSHCEENWGVHNEVLDLKGFTDSDLTVDEVLAKVSRDGSLSSVVVLDASDNGMTDEVFDSFTQRMQDDYFDLLGGLKYIDLGHNRISAKSTKNLMIWLEKFGGSGKDFRINVYETPLRNANILKCSDYLTFAQMRDHFLFNSRSYLSSMRSKKSPVKPQPYAVYSDLGEDWFDEHLRFYDGPTFKVLSRYRETLAHRAWTDFTSDYGDASGGDLAAQFDGLSVDE